PSDNQKTFSSGGTPKPPKSHQKSYGRPEQSKERRLRRRGTDNCHLGVRAVVQRLLQPHRQRHHASARFSARAAGGTGPARSRNRRNDPRAPGRAARPAVGADGWTDAASAAAAADAVLPAVHHRLAGPVLTVAWAERRGPGGDFRGYCYGSVVAGVTA